MKFLKKNKVTIVLVLIALVVVVMNSQWFSEVKRIKSNESYTLTSKEEIEFGDKYKPGYYTITYKNNDSNQTGTFADFVFHDGDTLRGQNYEQGNKISYFSNGGFFEMKPMKFEKNINTITKPGYYYIKKELKKGKYEICNDGSQDVSTNAGVNIEKNKCETIDMKHDLGSSKEISFSIKRTSEEIDAGKSPDAGKINLTLKEV